MTLMRDGLGLGIFFLTYETLKNKYYPMDQYGQRKKFNFQFIFCAGGISGVAWWVCCLPFDVLKTIMQTDNLKNLKYKTTLDAAKYLKQKEGFKY